jgi:hypothetical protein
VLGGLGVTVVNDTALTYVSNQTNLLGFASWGSNANGDPGAPFYGTIGGHTYPGTFAPRSIAADLVSTSARTFVAPAFYDQSLSADLVKLGAGGVAGSVFEPFTGGLARAPVLFRHYFQGTRAIEAYYRSVPYLSWMNVWIGDPLMTSGGHRLPGHRHRRRRRPERDRQLPLRPEREPGDTNGDGFGNLCDGDVDNDGTVDGRRGA